MSELNSQHWTVHPEKLEAFVLHRMDEMERTELALHLEQCDECRQRVEKERELITGIRRFGRVTMKRRLKSRLQHDQMKRFEWTQVASIAAAIVLVFGAVFAIRWFVDFKRETPLTREIILSENKEEKPAERALWIIGRVIEISDKSSRSAGSEEEKQSLSFADHIKETPALLAEKDLKSDEEARSRIETSAMRAADEMIIAEEKLSLHNVTNSKTKGEPALTARSDSESREFALSETKESSKLTAQDKLESRVAAVSRAMQSSSQMALKKLESIDTVSSKATGRLVPMTQPELESRDTSLSKVKESPAPMAKNKVEFRKTSPAKAKGSQALVAKKVRRDIKGPAIIVRRGDMKELPASMRNGDASAIHTRLERTPQGIQLTFYSNVIKDTVATDIEAVTQDSIIVTFSKRQIAYHIPGGWAGKM
jgi:hypothetical protein